MGALRFHQSVIFTLLFFIAYTPIAYAKDSTLYVDSYGKQRKFTVELASKPAELEQGLMYRKKLDADRGMLFVFPKQKVHAMWMKNTYISLDMLFIDRHGMIVHIHENAKPMSTNIITSIVPVKAVLEVRGGTCEKMGIQKGDRIIHETFTTTSTPR